jgi:hypothetical protein
MKPGYTLVLAFVLFYAAFVLGQFSQERMQRVRDQAITEVIMNANMALKTEKYRFYFRRIDDQVVLTYPPPSLRIAKEKAMLENVSFN